MKVNISQIKFNYIRSSGPGGQNVNKVATAVELRFTVPEEIRSRFSKKLTREGELIIKANRFRTQERNKQDALDRLQELFNQANVIPKKRKKTKPTFSSKQRRLTEKKLHSKNKSLRRSKPLRED